MVAPMGQTPVMQWPARLFTLGLAAVVAVIAFGLLALDTHASTATARWSCGSVLQPEHDGFASEPTPTDARLFFLEGKVACVEARNARLGRAIGLALPAALFATIAWRSKVPAEPAEVASP